MPTKALQLRYGSRHELEPQLMERQCRSAIRQVRVSDSSYKNSHWFSAKGNKDQSRAKSTSLITTTTHTSIDHRLPWINLQHRFIIFRTSSVQSSNYFTECFAFNVFSCLVYLEFLYPSFRSITGLRRICSVLRIVISHATAVKRISFI